MPVFENFAKIIAERIQSNKVEGYVYIVNRIRNRDRKHAIYKYTIYHDTYLNTVRYRLDIPTRVIGKTRVKYRSKRKERAGAFPLYDYEESFYTVKFLLHSRKVVTKTIIAASPDDAVLKTMLPNIQFSDIDSIWVGSDDEREWFSKAFGKGITFYLEEVD
jgi:hypothetical protein